jgi:hypothetical protein
VGLLLAAGVLAVRGRRAGSRDPAEASATES